MNKILSFILNFLLGIVINWISIAIYAKFLPVFLPDEIGFFILPLMCVLATYYFYVKKFGRISAIGLFGGFTVGFILLMLGLGLGGA